MLSPYRALDLTTERGLLCGQILADLGADVVKVEPPGGSPARRLGPFLGDEPHPDRSLFWWAYNRNKRAITLDLEQPEGRAILRRLAERTDFLIESGAPGALARCGLGPADLAAVNPRLIYVSISPFGQTGPKAGYAASDLTVMAASGPLFVTGDADRPPLRVSVPQAFLHASAEAAAGALIALQERHRSGLGQHVDVSAQQAAALATQSGSLAGAVGWIETERVTGGAKVGPVTLRFVFPAKDGHVSITHVFGVSIGRFTRRLMEWVHEEGCCDAATRDKDWDHYFELLFSGQEPFAELERVKQVVADFTSTKTKAELLAAALARGLLIAPVATMAEVVASKQLAARDYWRSVEHPELGRTFRYPGPFARPSAMPIAYRRRPPLVGEHNREIYAGELGLGERELDALRAQGVI
jgi:crotonobetainyl-CoA:carnitine CoA-transferase CaiB-like acyl-CoA transferase